MRADVSLVFRSIEDAGPAEDDQRDKRPPRVLVVFFNKLGHLLYRQGWDVDYEIEVIGEANMLKGLGVPLTDGVWVCECKLVPNGPSDWPGGGTEYALDGTWRPASAEEWAAFVADEWVWEEAT